MCFCSHVRNFTLICGPFNCIIFIFFLPNFYEKKCNCLNCSLNFIAHALQLELNKIGYTNFVKFRLQSISSKIERAFKKMTKLVFVFILPTQTLLSFFLHFLINFFSSSFIISLIFSKCMWWIPFSIYQWFS